MTAPKKVIPLLFLAFLFNALSAQQTPLNPLYYWVFTPYVYNPAFAGTKDFLSVDLHTSFRGKSNTEMLGAMARIPGKGGSYFSSTGAPEYSNFGASATIFHDYSNLSRNTGISAGGSYHLPLGKKELSFVSFGLALKGVYNSLENKEEGVSLGHDNTFFGNIDLGVTFYGADFYAGISAVNLLGTPGKADSLGIKKIPVHRQYFFSGGYKIVLSRPLNIVLEPAVLINSYDSNLSDLIENIDPVLKLYVDNFCVGSYFFTGGTAAFFAKYKYPGFYIGTFFEIPRDTPFYKRTPTVELTFGLNLQTLRNKMSGTRHW